MNITEIKVKNFRLLKDIKLTLDKTTLIVGKNNCGKTSFIEVMNIFLNDKKSLCADDFNLSFLKESLSTKTIPTITFTLVLTYCEKDSWENLIPFMTTLEDNNKIKLQFEYKPTNDIKFNEEMEKIETVEELKKIINKNYKIFRYTCSLEENSNYKLEISNESIKKLFKFYSIEAQRKIDDSNSTNNGNRFSEILNQHYENIKENSDGDEEIETVLKKIENSLNNSSKALDSSLDKFFHLFKTSFKDFGFPSFDTESQIILKSNLDSKILFKNLMKIYYSLEGEELPEKYNGLGYSNLLYIITKVLSFQLTHNSENNTGACLISIEEPEAHMHPQMQKVFIEKINNFFNKVNFNCQILITTHSSEIVCNSDFKSIRYFFKNNNNTKIKDLNDFKPDSSENDNFNFLKKYICSGKTEIFFADKIIMVEGLTERILMPKFIEKIVPNNSEYISILEIGGAYMYIFKNFLKFLKIKTLIITDIDCIKSYGKKEKVEITTDERLKTSNVTLKNWLPQKELITELLSASSDEKKEDQIFIVYQKNYEQFPLIKCGRTFEEDFIIKNYQYIYDNKSKITSFSKNRALKKFTGANEVKENSYKLYKYISNNKSNFAFDILLSEDDGWKTPDYIEEGLKWLLIEK